MAKARLRVLFPKLSEAKLNAGVLNGLTSGGSVRMWISKCLTPYQYVAWTYLADVSLNFLGKKSIFFFFFYKFFFIKPYFVYFVQATNEDQIIKRMSMQCYIGLKKLG